MKTYVCTNFASKKTIVKTQKNAPKIKGYTVVDSFATGANPLCMSGSELLAWRQNNGRDF